MPPPEKRTGFLGSALILLSIVAAVALATAGYFVMEGSPDGATTDVLIPRGSTIGRISERLAKEGVIQRPGMFRLLLRMTNGEHRVRAGEFRFRQSMRPMDALYTLYEGEPIVHTVTVPEGWNIRQIADIIQRAGLGDGKKFAEMGLAKETAAKYKIDAPNLEGFLYPDTYAFSKIDGEERILETMVRKFQSKFTDEYKKRAQAMGFSMVELVTLASIIEKETGVPTERRLISAVFHNRLKKKMRLQSDPTTIYGIKDFNGNLTKAHLLEATPYNTYKIKALPPGPIANPGWEAILATLDPAPEEYLYFVANGQGTHLFSKTYKEHNDYVTRYQKMRNTNRVPSKK
jgi:UPF0755 protein